MRKLLLVLTIMALLAVSMAACVAPAAPATTEQAPAEPAAAEPAAAEPAAEPVTIQVFYPVAVDAPIADILNGYIEQFEAENPNINVEPVFSGGYTDVSTAIQTTIDGGGQPPALAVLLATDLYDLINADYILPLDSYINAMPEGETYLADFFPAPRTTPATTTRSGASPSSAAMWCCTTTLTCSRRPVWMCPIAGRAGLKLPRL